MPSHFKLWWHYGRFGRAWHSGFTRWQCSRCGSRRFREEIISGCGWCDACWQYAYDTDPALGGWRMLVKS